MQRLQTTKANGNALLHLGDALSVEWRCYCEALKRCRKRISPRAVHDSRVDTRRLLSTLELLKPFASQGDLAKTSAMLKDYLDGFDELRDIQVQLISVGKMRKDFSAAKSFHHWLEKREARSARKTRKAVKSFKTKRLARRIAELEKEILVCSKRMTRDQSFALVLRPVRQAFRRVAQLRRQIKADDPGTIHRTRIAFKHFRYMVEELSPLLPVVTKGRREEMRDYQSKMGDIQDVKILLKTFDGFLCKKKADPVAAEKFRDNLKRRERRLIEIFLDSADDLNNFKL